MTHIQNAGDMRNANLTSDIRKYDIEKKLSKRKTFSFKLRVEARVGGGDLDPGNKIPLWAPIQNARDMRSANKS